MKETLSARCFKTWTPLPNNTIRVPDSPSDLFASSFPVPNEIFVWWRAIPKPEQMRLEPALCTAPYSRKRPLWDNPGCQLPHYMHRAAPRCQTKLLKWVCEQASIPHNVTDKKNRFVLPESDHRGTEVPPQPFLITARRVLISMCGHIVTNCGIVRTTANCMAEGFKEQARLFESKCPLSVAFSSDSSASLSCLPGAPWSQAVARHQRVFVVAQVDDTYVYHIHLEIVPRLAYHLKFLLDNPDVKILVGCDVKKRPEITKAGLEHGLQSLRPFMALLGLSMSRLVVHNHVRAEEAFLPMEGACQDPVFNTWQILSMRNLLMTRLGLHDDSAGKKAPVMMLIKRSSNAKHTRNGHDSVRQWSDGFAQELLGQLQLAFPSFRLVLFSDRNETLMRCAACQIQAFAETDVLIGVHGAGLSNMLYMKPNSAVVEIAPYGNDGRCVLGGGPFSRLAAVMGHNYAIHFPLYGEYKWIAKESVSEFDSLRLVDHIMNFLASIGKI